MSPQDTIYFWTWYKTGFGKSGKRSFRRAAKLLHKDIGTLVRLAESSDPTWYELAEQKDAEIIAQLDEAVIESILSEADEVLKRHRIVIRELFKKLVKAIQDDKIEYKLSDVIKLFEYDARQSGGRTAESDLGESLAGLLNFVGSDTRSELHRAYRRSRLLRDDDILGEKLGRPSSN